MLQKLLSNRGLLAISVGLMLLTTGVVEAHGAGASTVGPLLFTLHKTVQATEPLAHGCLQLSTANQDTLNAINDTSLGAPNDHGFGTGSDGNLTFTRGTGRFQTARGSAKLGSTFTIIYPASSIKGHLLG